MSNSKNSAADTNIQVDSPGSSQQSTPTDELKVEQLQAHIAEVSNIMQENIGKILERGARLDQIENRTDILTNRADEFRIASRRVRNKMWWQNCRMNLFLLLGFSVIVALIVFWFWDKNQKNN